MLRKSHVLFHFRRWQQKRADIAGSRGLRHGGIDEIWMQSEPCRPEAYYPYVGGHRAKRAPKIAIPPCRSSSDTPHV